jgi:hypothetical protein
LCFMFLLTGNRPCFIGMQNVETPMAVSYQYNDGNTHGQCIDGISLDRE